MPPIASSLSNSTMLLRYNPMIALWLSFSLLTAYRSSVEASLFGVGNLKPFLGRNSQRRTDARLETHDPLLSLRGGASDKIEGPCIGIDLGTTYSCVAVWKNGRVDVCPNEQGNRITPSYVAFLPDGTRLVGDAAKNQAPSNPSGTFFDVKRLIGRKFTDATVQQDKTLLPFTVDKDGSGKPILVLEGESAAKHSKKQYNPEEISGMLLRKLKETGKGTLQELLPVLYRTLLMLFFLSGNVPWMRSQARCGDRSCLFQ